jgi:hypothetical protein
MTGNQAFALQQVIVGMGWIWAICEAWSMYKEHRALRRRRRRKRAAARTQKILFSDASEKH